MRQVLWELAKMDYNKSIAEGLHNLLIFSLLQRSLFWVQIWFPNGINCWHSTNSLVCEQIKEITKNKWRFCTDFYLSCDDIWVLRLTVCTCNIACWSKEKLPFHYSTLNHSQLWFFWVLSEHLWCRSSPLLTPLCMQGPSSWFLMYISPMLLDFGHG